MLIKNSSLRTLWVVIATCFSAITVKAQNAYLYLEGIKNMPFNISVNGNEVNRLSKNYALITFDSIGEYNIDIRFGGDIYPEQSFVVNVLKNSAYGFKLAKTLDNKFYLVDLVNANKIVETNSSVNIGLTTSENQLHFSDPSSIPEVVEKSSKRKAKQKIQQMEAIQDSLAKVKTEEKKTPEYGIVEVIEGQSNNTNQVQDSIVIVQNKETSPEKQINEEQKTVPKEAAPKPVAVKKAAVKNNCRKSASDEEINELAETIKNKNDDEARLLIVKRKVFSGCLSSSQCKQLAQTFSSQYGIYSCVKVLSAILSDKENLFLVEDLFRSESYKKKIREL